MDRYSRLIAFLKVLLPLAALALLSTLFLISRGIDLDATIPFAEQEIADRTRDQQVTQPYYAGVTDNGGEIIVTASVASPGIGDKPAQARNLSAQIRTQSGVTITMQAATGMLEGQTDKATFTGDVVLETSSGYRVESQEIEADLEGVWGRSPGAISGRGPPGLFTAGEMEMRTETETGEVHTLFKSGVKLVYDPKQVER
jgi:lipopolysaccharide export system protein LptC